MVVERLRQNARRIAKKAEGMGKEARRLFVGKELLKSNPNSRAVAPLVEAFYSPKRGYFSGSSWWETGSKEDCVEAALKLYDIAKLQTSGRDPDLKPIFRSVTAYHLRGTEDEDTTKTAADVLHLAEKIESKHGRKDALPTAVATLRNAGVSGAKMADILMGRGVWGNWYGIGLKLGHGRAIKAMHAGGYNHLEIGDAFLFDVSCGSAADIARGLKSVLGDDVGKVAESFLLARHWLHGSLDPSEVPKYLISAGFSSEKSYAAVKRLLNDPRMREREGEHSKTVKDLEIASGGRPMNWKPPAFGKPISIRDAVTHHLNVGINVSPSKAVPYPIKNWQDVAEAYLNRKRSLERLIANPRVPKLHRDSSKLALEHARTSFKVLGGYYSGLIEKQRKKNAARRREDWEKGRRPQYEDREYTGTF